MALLLGILNLSALLISAFAEYSLNLHDPATTLTYNYDSPLNYTDALVKVKLNLDYSYYNNLFSTGDGAPIDIITVRSPSGPNDLFDYMAFQLMASGMPDGPPLLMVIISSPLSSQDFSATTFCIGMSPYDFSDKLITVDKTGQRFTLDIEGLEQSESNYYCQNYLIGKSGSGRMDLSTVMIGPHLKGCVSLLSFPGVDLLPADDCGFPVEHLSGDAVYFEGVCSGDIPDTSVVCPTTPPPTTKPATTKPPTTKVPTTKVPTTKAATTRAPTTPLPKIETTQPVEPTDKETTPTEKLPQPVTDPKVETDPPVVTDEPTTDKPETVKPDPTTAVPIEVIDNETEGEEGEDDYNINTVDVTDTEAATGDDENNNSVVIIICVVSAGIVVIVVLLYVGYRFHFRDKGSYKLEETKETSPNGEDFGNEYTDLNPTSKDQEWYL
ncbi:uncharacterized protein LOC134812333 [Bolinopsis microptera]|uniref:uncharacterized protein LOC134812333 n=1 Tax=Bolinopsis microptera TaxID=2820187 RepID=UPI0030794B80